MEWFPLDSVVDSKDFAISDDAQVGTWLRLMRYCTVQENGGVIKGAKLWKDREWLLSVKTTQAHVMAGGLLWHWKKNDLIVFHYPERNQAKINGLRKRAKEAADARWHKESAPNGMPSTMPNGMPNDIPEGNADREIEREITEDRKKERVIPAELEAIYLAYPKHVGKAEALKVIRGLIAHGRRPEELLERTTAYAEAAAGWPADQRQFVPHPATWFRRGSFDDDPAVWVWKNSSGGGAAAGGDFDPSKPNAHTGGVAVAN